MGSLLEVGPNKTLIFDFFYFKNCLSLLNNNATANKWNRKETLAQVCKYKCAETLTDVIHDKNQ